MEHQEPFVLPRPEKPATFWQHHRFMLLVIGTIVISLALVIISLVIYNTTGANQLDLSRPGYQGVVSDKVDRDKEVELYSAFGPVNDTSIDEFLKLYDKQADKAKAVEAFNGDPLNPEVLEFGTTTVTE